MHKFISVIFVIISFLQPTLTNGKTVKYDKYCLEGSLRETTILVDGTTMTFASGEQYWRTQIKRFLDASKDEASVYMTPGERIRVGLLMPDGSGTAIEFSGCMPILPKSVIAENTENESTISWLINGGWERNYQADQEEFVEAAIISLSTLMRDIDGKNGELEIFSESNTLASLANYRKAHTAQGVSRVFLVTDLSHYTSQGNVQTVADAAMSDARESNLDFGYSKCIF